MDEISAEHAIKAAVEQTKLLGARLRVLRRKKGWTQAKLARVTGIEAANISRIENGHFNIRFSTLCKILGAIGYSLSDLF